ncbi:CPBP family intramembrane glutamic endopeptidase [Gilvibacter sp.]|uniref:CPBP family intramembrane glutamic endopeptidase n=1 Tax=Gilvibacter sp. TaxID=2729997 RepID=UPI003F49D66A
MLGLLVLLLISWGLLFLIEKKNLNALGLIPSKDRLLQFGLGLAILVPSCLVLIGIETAVQSVQWQRTEFDLKTLAEAFYYHWRSALTEDLVFRGALLYILLQRLGSQGALWISAVCFGVYHVFSYGILEDSWILIAYVIVITGFTGYVWAYAFSKTRSMYLGLGFHMGYNLLMACFYQAQPYGELLFSEVSKQELLDPLASFYSIFRGLVPTVLTFLSLKVLFNMGWIPGVHPQKK